MALRASRIPTLPVATSRELAAAATPYPAARFERGDLTAELRRSLRRSQAAVLVLAALGLALVAGLLHTAGRTRVVPYVVEVDRHGEPRAFGPAEPLTRPDRRILLHTLALWVRSTRTVTADRELQRELVGAGYELTGGRAVALLNGWYESHPPFARSAAETVSVQQVESILAAGDSEHWRLQWVEEIRNPGGILLRRESWQALVEVEVDPPQSVEEVLANPLGIRITDFDWQRLSSEAHREGVS